MEWIAGRSMSCAGRSWTTTSAGISRLLALEDALQGFEMRAGVFWGVGTHEPVSSLDYFRAHRAKLPAHRARQHLQAASALQVVHRVERLRDRGPDDDHAVVGEEHHSFAAHRARQAI